MVAHVRDARAEHNRKVKIAVAATIVIALYIAMMWPLALENERRARVAAVRERRSAYGSTTGFKRTPRWPDREKKHKWLLGYKSSYWWQTIRCLNASADEHPQLLKQFKAKTLVGWPIFEQLLHEMSDDATMVERADVSIPLSMKLCASLRYVATGASLHAMQDAFGVSAQVLRDFFWKKFLPWMMDNKYSEIVRAPNTFAELAHVVNGFEAAGFPGCAGSVGSTHIHPVVGFQSRRSRGHDGKRRLPDTRLRSYGKS